MSFFVKKKFCHFLTMSTTASSKSSTSFDDLSIDESVQISETIRNVDAREELASQIIERQDRERNIVNNITIRE